MKRFLLLSLALGLVLFTCEKKPTQTTSTETTNGTGKVSGILVDCYGNPVAGAKVQLFDVRYVPSFGAKRLAVNSNRDTIVMTDSEGKYFIPLPDSGSYNIYGETNDGLVVLINNVAVKDTSGVKVRTDTLRTPGQIKGISFMPGQNDTNQVRMTIYIPGTKFLTKPAIGGYFSFTKIPKSRYQLIFDPTLPDYKVKVIDTLLTAGEIIDLDTVIIYGGSITGIPTVNAGNDTTVSINDTIKLHGIAKDTLGRIIKMEWDIGNNGSFIETKTGDTNFVAPNAAANLKNILRVVDNDGNIVYDTVTVSVIQDVPLVIILGPSRIAIDSNTIFTAQTFQKFGNIVKYRWRSDLEPGFIDSTGPSFTYKVLMDTTTAITLEVTDDDGNIKTAVKTIIITNDTLQNIWAVLTAFPSSSGSYPYITMAVDNGIPYVAYNDGAHGQKATVLKYVANNWAVVGTEGFSGTIDNTCLSFCVDNGTPYVLYADYDNSSKATVMKFDGNNWIFVGQKDFSDGKISKPSICAFNGVMYVAYRDEVNGLKPAVMTFDGNNWTTVGEAVTQLDVGSMVFALDAFGTPYIAYEDAPYIYNQVTVKKYNGTDWVLVGQEHFSSCAGYTRLAFDNNIPYVAYVDINIGNKITVQKYNGSNWVLVGPRGFSGSYDASRSSIAIDNGIPYVAFNCFADRKIVVDKFDGSSWSIIGGEILNVNAQQVFSSIAFLNGIPYVAFIAGNNFGEIMVLR